MADSKTIATVSATAVDDNVSTSVATHRGPQTVGREASQPLEDNKSAKSDDGLKTNDPERNEAEDERQLVNGGVVIRDGGL